MASKLLNALHFAGNLKCIDLHGAFGLTSDCVKQFSNTLQCKQGPGEVQPCVTLLLPLPCLEKPEAVFYAHVSILLSYLYQLPTNPLASKLVIHVISELFIGYILIIVCLIWCRCKFLVVP